jgi:hypothetical protein
MTFTGERSDRDRSYVWTLGVLAASAPLLMTLCLTLWRTPYPINEAVALFEDVAKKPPADFLIPDTSYYRPLFHLTLMGIWRNAGSLEARLAWIKVMHIAPVLLLVLLFIWHLHPRRFPDAAAAAVAAAVLVASPGFRDNLEIPLSYTAMAMPIALVVWMRLNREPRAWHTTVIVALTLMAIGFKEQGLVLIPLVIVAWWTRAPGASRALVISLTAIAVAYVAFRLHWRGKWPLFEQSMGLGFGVLETDEATARFGAFPYWMYAYNSASTMANVLFSEPTSGLFFITRNLRYGGLQAWEVLQLGSSAALTGVIGWWGIGSLKGAAQGRWSIESRTFLAMLVALLACGILSFDYSRDRLGGMVVVFYALAAFYALRAAAERIVVVAPRPRFVLASLALAILAGAWHVRAVGILESVRRTSNANEVGWLVQLAQRRTEFADRPVYLQIMDAMIDQGTDKTAPRPTPYPRWIDLTLGPR